MPIYPDIIWSYVQIIHTIKIRVKDALKYKSHGKFYIKNWYKVSYIFNHFVTSSIRCTPTFDVKMWYKKVRLIL